MTYLFEGAEWSWDKIRRSYEAIEKIGVEEMKYDIYPNSIEIITAEQMLDAYSSIGLPVYYNHWSFGKHYTQDFKNYKSGYSGLAYEIVCNVSPTINYLMEDNTMMTQALVLAHAAMGHNFFFKNNYLFKQWTDAESIVDYLVFAKEYVAKTEEREGLEEVEAFLDSCHALMNYGVNRYKRPSKLSIEKESMRQREREEYLQSQVTELYGAERDNAKHQKKKKINFPENPEENILYFCEKHSPNLKPWQRELLRIVRKIAQYLYPQGQTQVANEGFAVFSHYTIMNRLHEKGLTTEGTHLEFLEMHSNVLYQPVWNDRSYSGRMNPYKLGFEIYRDIERICTNPTDEDREWFPDLIGMNALEAVKDAAINYRDESFIRQFLSPKLIRDFKFFHVFDDRMEDEYVVKAIQNEAGYHNIRENLANQYERETFVPKIEVFKVDPDDRSLHLCFHSTNERLLKNPKRMLRHVKNIWGYPVLLRSNDGSLITSSE